MGERYDDGEKVIYCQFDEQLDLSQLKNLRNPENRNKHSSEQIERLAKQMREPSIGIRHPIVISKRSGLINKGDGRFQAAALNKYKTYPVQYQDYDSFDAEYSDGVADNALALWAELDMQGINSDLAGLGPDWDVDFLGLKDFTLEPADKYADQDADEVPEVKTEPKVQRGELWTLGKHRLLCGDSTSKEDLERLMETDRAQIVFTDPPYNVKFNGRSGKFDVIENDDLETHEFDDFIQAVCTSILELNPDHYYVWCNWKFYAALQTRLPFKACIVWAKNVFGLGIGYRHQHEFCLFNGSLDANVTNESDLWEIAKDREYQHPTQKPVALSERALKNHSRATNVVDLFGGSGSTLIGCEKTGRRAFVMEIDPHYTEVILERWAKFTGQDPVRENGTTWSELKTGKDQA